MKTIGNILWVILGGIWTALGWLFLGLLLCITIIGIPFGKQCFKFAKLYLWPMGKKVKPKFTAHPIANTLWVIFFGWEMALLNFFSGLLLCITIIGIPFGLQMFKLMKLSLIPFGATVS